VKRTVSALALLIATAVTQSPAAADEPWRIGVLVASNRGNQGRVPLRYAEQDATDLAAVLGQLGGFQSGDLYVLRGQSLAAVRGVMTGLKSKLAAARASGRRVVMLFYFSGHSDGESLELGDDRWPFADVRQTLLDLGAEIRITIVDSCQSGALLREKGGRPGPTFDIRFNDDLATSGEATLTSSAAHEAALESRQIRASFFSHHLITGLRGAADSSGDGRVTLGEAYRYAFVNTLLATSNTLNGPQHPEYDYRLTGRGELVLTDVLARGAKLSLPSTFDRIVIADPARQHLIAELTNASARRIALPAGRYVVQGRKDGRTLQIAVDLHEGESREIAAAELAPSSGAEVVAKGDDLIDVERRDTESASPPRALSFGVGLGVTRGVANALPWVGDLRLATAVGERRGWRITLDLATGRTAGFRESVVHAGGGYYVGAEYRRLMAAVGWQVMVGPVVQSVDAGQVFWTMSAGTGPWVDGAWRLTRGLSVHASVGVNAVVLRRDQNIDSTLSPVGSITATFRP
jgi:hypothetical protein